jgi:hypothetical protein
MDDTLEKKLERDLKNSIRHKKRYWYYRNLIIEYLGGECMKCHSKDKLEIHHDPPILYSEKRNGFPRGSRCGGLRIRDWKLTIEGKMKAKLLCHDCHITGEHNGNTNELKKR